MSVEIKLLTINDVDHFSELIGVFEEVFEWNDFSFPDSIYLKKMLDNKGFLSFIAIKDGKVIGGLTAYILDRYDSEKPAAYIYDLAVLVEYQRKGAGKQLIAAINGYCEENGFSEVFVQTETDDLQAINFYRTTPINNELRATHFTYSFTNGNAKK
jgi:aminoglycoside 3-N-acetyltransferase I